MLFEILYSEWHVIERSPGPFPPSREPLAHLRGLTKRCLSAPGEEHPQVFLRGFWGIPEGEDSVKGIQGWFNIQKSAEYTSLTE